MLSKKAYAAAYAFLFLFTNDRKVNFYFAVYGAHAKRVLSAAELEVFKHDHGLVIGSVAKVANSAFAVER